MHSSICRLWFPIALTLAFCSTFADLDCSAQEPLAQNRNTPKSSESNPTPEQVAAAGLREVSGKHIRLITDLPLDDEIRSLPLAFDQAVTAMQQLFQKPIPDIDQWKTVAYLMADRKRFVAAGFLTQEIPEFRDGYQAANRLFIVEQPSAYYRRHLLLHEGVHWFMASLNGGGGPAWFMEGMAEWISTHRWIDQRLQITAIPSRSDEVPYWGRVKRTQEDLRAGKAPSIESIMRVSSSSHKESEGYSWSWAAVLFFQYHPEFHTAFAKVSVGPMDYSQKLTKDLFTELRSEWPRVRMAWTGFVLDLDYGTEIARVIPRIPADWSELGQEKRSLRIDADHGWQSSGIVVQPGMVVQVNASGQYSLANDPKPWIAEPQGITLRYFRGQPLGKLLMTIAPLAEEETRQTTPWEATPVGRSLQLKVDRPGLLMFRINDLPSELSDNQGTCQVEVLRL